MIYRCLGGGLGLLLVVAAPAQTIGAGFLSSPRPSDLSPSTRVGRVAGGGAGPSAPSARNAGGYRGPSGANLPAFRGFGIGVDPDRNSFSRAFQPSLARRWFPRNNPGSLINVREGSASMRDLYAISYLDQATSMEVPLIGWESPRLPLEQGRVYVPPDDASPYHQFFGLAPSREIVAPIVETHLSAADRMGVINQSYIDDLMRRAKVAFKNGTTPGVVGREEYLARAMDLCDVVRRVDRDAWEPTMLHLHASLCKQRPERAMYDLYELAARNPELFKTRPNLDEFYGDSKLYMETTFRDYSSTVERSKPDAGTSLLQGYCAWILGDMARLRLALGRAEELNRADKNDKSIDRTRRALMGAFSTESASAEAPKP